jgi:hypothetical protein
MMNIIEKKRFSRDLSKEAAAVLMALFLAGGAVTTTDLANEWLDMGEEKVQRGLDRLAEYQLVTHHGKFTGWQLNLEQLSIWQGHSGVFLDKKATDISGVSVASPTLPAATDQVPDYEKTRISGFPDQIRSDRSFKPEKSDFKDQSDLICVIQKLGIRDPGRKRLLETNAQAADLYGWYLWSKEQTWIGAPVGWALKCTLKGSRPTDDYLEQAERRINENDVSLKVEKEGICPDCGKEIGKMNPCPYCTGIIKR